MRMPKVVVAAPGKKFHRRKKLVAAFESLARVLGIAETLSIAYNLKA